MKSFVILSVVFLLGLLLFNFRYTMIASYLQSNVKVQEIIIDEMLKSARPIILKQLKMTLIEKVYSELKGYRDEKSRQGDALVHIRAFIKFAFNHDNLNFKDLHFLRVVSDFPLEGFDLALTWKDQKNEEVLVAFKVDIVSRKIEAMKVNKSSRFFKELRAFVARKAKEN